MVLGLKSVPREGGNERELDGEMLRAGPEDSQKAGISILEMLIFLKS